MARSYARIMTAIWRNAEFRKLDSGAQRVYLLLVTQPDITAAGTLPLTVRRWADMASDTSVQVVTTALTMLADRAFVAFDRATEELLVRSFVKWDGGYTNSKRRPVIFEAARDLASEPLRRVLATEFRRLGLPLDALRDALSDGVSDDPSDDEDVPEPVEAAQPEPETLFSQVDRLSDALSGKASPTASDRATPSERVVVSKQVSTSRATTKRSKPIPPTAGDESPTVQALIAAWIDQCRKRPPGNVIGQIGKHVKALLEEGIEPVDVSAGLEVWASKSLHPSTLPSVVNEVMNRPATVHHLHRGPTVSGSTRMDKALAALVPDDPYLAQFIDTATDQSRPAFTADHQLVIEGGRTA